MDNTYFIDGLTRNDVDTIALALDYYTSNTHAVVSEHFSNADELLFRFDSITDPVSDPEEPGTGPDRNYVTQGNVIMVDFRR